MKLKTLIRNTRDRITNKIDRKLNPPVTVSMYLYARYMFQNSSGTVHTMRHDLLDGMYDIELQFVPRAGDTFRRLTVHGKDFFGTFTVKEVIWSLKDNPEIILEAAQTDFASWVKTPASWPVVYHWREATPVERDLFLAGIDPLPWPTSH